MQSVQQLSVNDRLTQHSPTTDTFKHHLKTHVFL